jgi:hypothetical protein
MNSNVYFKSVSYGLIQTIFITNQISGPLSRYEYQAFSLSLSLSCSNHLFNLSNAFMSLTGSTLQWLPVKKFVLHPQFKWTPGLEYSRS